MPSLFDITAVESRVTADGGSASAVLTIHSNAAVPVRVQMILRPGGGTGADWLDIAGGAEADLKPGETRQVTVTIAIPQSAPFGDYPFSVLVCSVDNPDEHFTAGPSVSVRHQPAPVVKLPKKFPWLLVIILVLCAGGGVLFWLLHRESGKSNRWRVAAETEQAMHAAEHLMQTARVGLADARRSAAAAAVELQEAQKALVTLQQKIDDFKTLGQKLRANLPALEAAAAAREAIARQNPQQAGLQAEAAQMTAALQGLKAQIAAVDSQTAGSETAIATQEGALAAAVAADKNASLKVTELEAVQKDLDAKAAAAKEAAEAALKLAKELAPDKAGKSD